MTVAPYGSWSSPVTVDMITSASVGLGAPVVDGTDLYWTESRAEQGGRNTVIRQSADGTRVELTPPPFDVRSRVHEYGGGEYAARNGQLVFSDVADGRLYLVRSDGPPVPLTPRAAYRFADLRLHPERNVALAVREDHSGGGEPVNTVVALGLDGDLDGGAVLCCGADFYADPELARDGRLAWTEWDHPAMPWDATRIRVALLLDQRLVDVEQVAGGPAESAMHPRWTPDGTLIFLSDQTNWWNLYAWSAAGGTRALHPVEHDCGGPLWRLGQSPHAMVGDDEIVLTWTDQGVGSLARLELSTGQLRELTPLGTSTASISVDGGRAAAVLSSPDRPRRLVVFDLATSTETEVRRSSELRFDADVLSQGRPVSWSSDQGAVHGWYYPPTNRGWTAPPGTLPPLITLSHGGPTGFSPSDFDLEVQYWTSRGVAILDVNYGGSAGYGRAYRERLRGRWGLVDVADCARGAQVMGERGLADPERLAIAGGSAGGYTTLRALTATKVFAAGISRYGVGDLESLARDTHKFESRYLDGLVGPYPGAAEVYRDRSPVHHVDQLTAPILLLQGADDRVVPPNQADAMAAAARAKGLPVALIMFDGEGHGFRRAENIRAALEAELYFLGRVFGFDPADQLPAIEIDNLPTN